MKNFYILFFIFLFFVACQDEEKKLIYPAPTNYIKLQNTQTPLEYLNYQRTMSGLVGFTKNDFLEKSAKNHAIYEVKNKHTGHEENIGEKYFTGKSPSQRALFAGYQSNLVGENISYNDNIYVSIDSLFTAIYHRFAFLSFEFDEVGFSFQKEKDTKSAVFQMGNSRIRKMCENGGDKNPRRYYQKVCKNENIKLDANRYENAKIFTNTEKVVFPFDESEDVAFSFSGEIPDPIPECKITANPLSIEFSPSIKDIKMKSFKVYENDKEIKNTKILTAKNDLHEKLTENQFALFALNVFKFDTKYKGVFEYSHLGQDKKIQWTFKTKIPKYDFVRIKGGENIAIMADTWYDIFFNPKDCNDLVKRYSYKTPPNTKVKIKQNGANYFSIKVFGEKNTKINLKTSNNKEITFILQNNSKGIEKNRKQHLIIGVLILLLAVFVGIFRKRKN